MLTIYQSRSDLRHDEFEKTEVFSDVLISRQAGRTERSRGINKKKKVAGSALFIFLFSQSDAYPRATKPPLLSQE